MSSSGTDEKRSPAVSCITTFLTISFLVIMTFTGFMLLKLTSAVDKLQRDMTEIQMRQLSADGAMKQLNDILLEYGGGRVKRAAPSPSQSSGVAVNVGHVFVSLIKQMCKPEGSICIPGEPGRDGLPGLSGEDGSVGLPGPPGRDGRIGLRGTAGTNGLPGKNGGPGSKGSSGKQGPRGIAGVKGDMGERGEKGDKGERGERGMGGQQGIAGTQGEKGEAGENGKRGWTGYKGEKGGKGESGLRGEKGLKGGRGMRGERGMKGVRGMKGERGMKGVRGMKGTSGDMQDFRELTGLPSQCLPGNHRVLTETWRKTSEHYSNTYRHCDNGGNSHGFEAGWHSFSPTIGGAMPETCTSQNYCGTYGSGWLKGSHPTLIGGRVSRRVCFSYAGGCCWRQMGVEVINCGMYYVYNLPYTPGCDLAYCAQG